jgi:DMSO/TMAO reductase YedYZ molybdopterin-dependent catalytic subunit
VDVVFTGLDRGIDGGVEQAYERSLSVEEALDGEALLAWELNGEPLPPQHGAPLRLVVPGWYGMTSVKWLERITVLDRPFEGYQQAQAYRFRRSEEDEGVPVTRIWPRALMVPPGVPDFMTRERFVQPGPCVVQGRAWSGLAPVASVDVSTDGGETWTAAQLEPAPDRWAWARWTWPWDAAPGEYELRCRARDEAGNEQPSEPEWNVGGYRNNSAQRVAVTVQSDS